MRLADNWQSYQVVGTGNGEKFERWGQFYLLRPDPQVIWESDTDYSKDKRLCGRYVRESSGGGNWQIKSLPAEWIVEWKNIKFLIKPMGFKHTGLFPEQATNWDLMINLIKKADRTIRVLNLFAYTGGASLACASAGASVTHVDASKGMVERAKENSKLSNISTIRWIVDDCEKFLIREIKRENKYDAIIMDPPSYGRGPNGEMWKLEDNLYKLVKLCKNVLSENPLFIIINSYTTGLAPSVLSNILTLVFGEKNVLADEIGLPTDQKIVLPCGATGVKTWM
ncbi:MAG: class I SAM-dependent methyltransferase [Clostridia bacterium]